MILSSRQRLLAALVVTVAVAALVPARAGAAVPHTVTAGETLWSIASANNFTTRSLAAFNGLPADGVVVVGSTIMIPSEAEAGAALGTVPAPAAPAAPAAAPSPAPAPAPAPTPPAQPSAPSGGHRTSVSEVGNVAAAQGVSPSLAAGVAYQESGFNNAAVSSAGAQGVMQVMPNTMVDISQRLTNQTLDVNNRVDNITAGSIYLRHLEQQTGDRTTAIAAYYQGLASVRANGIFPETWQYVRNVQAHQARFGG